MRKGDRVRVHAVDEVTYEGLVTATTPEQFRLGPRKWLERDGVGSVELLDRPLPPIPTDEGTVIRSKDSGDILVREGRSWTRFVGIPMPSADPGREDYDVLVPEQVEP